MPLRLDNAKGVAHMPTAEAAENRRSSRDSRLTTRHRRCQKPDSQNASRPGRHQIGRVGEIISESWARSNRYTRARSSESATRHKAPWTLLVGSTKRTLPTSKPRSKFSRKCRRPKTPIGRRKGNDWKLRCDGREGRAERVQRKHYLFERCFACKAVTAEE